MTTEVDRLTAEVELLRTDVTSLANLITKDVIPGVQIAVDALEGVVAATEDAANGLESSAATE